MFDVELYFQTPKIEFNETLHLNTPFCESHSGIQFK